MQGIERKYCDVCINALIGAWRELMEVSGAETLRKVPYGKGDTLGLDAIPEITITGRLREFDGHAILITEELDEQAHRRWPTDSDPVKQPLMFFSDPTDRSSQLEEFFKRLSKDNQTAKIGNLIADCDHEKLWEEMFEAPVIITGSTGSITCVRKGKIVFSVILNYIAGIVFVATDVGIYSYQLENFSDLSNEEINFSTIFKKGKKLNFPGVRELGYNSDDCKRFVTFLGKTGYRENFNDSMLFIKDPNEFLHHLKPPGPPRPLYLSELQKDHGPVGFILSNGEKIGEWMHWLSFVKYARNINGGYALSVYEISLERPWTKNGMLMSTSPAYSLFCNEGSGSYLDISRLRNFKRPSQFRCMIVVVPWDNERIIHVLKQHEYREITNYF
ncbi:hypothetical protein AMJ47_02635 [Parcubacteria bacterium DG_72]|nr:MAG: hypothetical protein AMJ47_02635 [Parcubacteria bacterium DG_72]